MFFVVLKMQSEDETDGPNLFVPQIMAEISKNATVSKSQAKEFLPLSDVKGIFDKRFRVYQHKRRFAMEWWGFANNCHWYFHRSVLKVDKLVKGGKCQVVVQYFDKQCFNSHPLTISGLWLICWLWELTGQRVLVGQTDGQSLFFMNFKFIAILLLGQFSWRRFIPIEEDSTKKTSTKHEI